MKKYFESHILASAVIKAVEQLETPQEATASQLPFKGVNTDLFYFLK